MLCSDLIVIPRMFVDVVRIFVLYRRPLLCEGKRSDDNIRPVDIHRVFFKSTEARICA